MQIRSGSNSFHGSAYWYNENNALKAKPFFLPAGSEKPKYIDNDAGGTFGGPILKDKLPSFSLAATRVTFCGRLPEASYTLPTPDMAQGILASPTPIFDPTLYRKPGWQRQNSVSTKRGRSITSFPQIESVRRAKAHSESAQRRSKTGFR